MAPGGTSLFGPDLPAGFQYHSDFVTEAEETALIAEITTLTFADFELRGVVARRRVAFFGESSYDRTAAPEIPSFLWPLRSRLATWARVQPDDFAMTLINEYRPGSPIGWHRDAPQYGIVSGVSLLAPCRMKFRRYVRPSAHTPGNPARRATHELTLEPRSAYLMKDESRHDYEHHIPPVSALRYSITFRTLR
jgi:alkylated DNA repair dioxygenase AlkB